MKRDLWMLPVIIPVLTACAVWALLNRPPVSEWEWHIALVNSTSDANVRVQPFRAIYQHDPVTVIYPKDGTGWRYDAGNRTWRRL